MFVLIYGRPGCAFCTRAVTLAGALKDAGAIQGFRYVDIHAQGISKSDLATTLGRPVHTVPQVLVDERHLGGFTEFDRYVREHGLLIDDRSA
jgi:glutaredoxin 1